MQDDSVLICEDELIVRVLDEVKEDWVVEEMCFSWLKMPLDETVCFCWACEMALFSALQNEEEEERASD